MAAKEDILELEREFWATMAGGEHRKSAKLLTPMAAMAGSMGTHRFSPDEYVKMSEQSPFTIDDWSMSEEDVIFPTPETAICMYRVNQTVTHDGKTEKMDMLDTSVWVRDGDSWKCAMHTEMPNAKPH
jgi:hypothetical protein